MKPVRVGRHINGITLNDLEYLLDCFGNVVTFSSAEVAEKFFIKQGMSEEEIRFLVFEEVD